CVEKFAQAIGKNADDIIDKKTAVFGGPDLHAACYCSPGINQPIALSHLNEKAAELAKSGVGLVGSFLPQAGGGVGFMDLAAVTAETAAKGIIASMEPERHKGKGTLPDAVQKPADDLEAQLLLQLPEDVLKQVREHDARAKRANQPADADMWG